jgi:hypothetical protein
MLILYLCVRGIDVDLYLCVRGIDVDHAFACYGYRCWSCIFVLEVSMLVMYLCARIIDVGHVFVC